MQNKIRYFKLVYCRLPNLGDIEVKAVRGSAGRGSDGSPNNLGSEKVTVGDNPITLLSIIDNNYL